MSDVEIMGVMVMGLGGRGGERYPGGRALGWRWIEK